MSLKARLQSFASKPKESPCIGLSLKQQHLDVSVVTPTRAIETYQFSMLDGQYDNAIASLAEMKVKGHCSVVLSSKQSHIVQVEKPNVPEAEINQALKWQIKDQVSIPPEDMIVDYYDTEVTSGGVERVNVVCASKAQLSNIVELACKHDLAVAQITIEEFAFAQLIPHQEDACLLLCQQPGEEMLILVVKQGQLHFQRRLRGMANIAERSEEELSMGMIDTLSLEIQRSLDYFERQLKQAPIKSIQVLVPMKNEGFLARKLAENATSEVHLFTMPEGSHEYREYAATIGAAMAVEAEARR
ncbi:MSHA biogenesis protein MshI [Thalassotalea fusca]